MREYGCSRVIGVWFSDEGEWFRASSGSLCVLLGCARDGGILLLVEVETRKIVRDRSVATGRKPCRWPVCWWRMRGNGSPVTASNDYCRFDGKGTVKAAKSAGEKI